MGDQAGHTATATSQRRHSAVTALSRHLKALSRRGRSAHSRPHDSDKQSRRAARAPGKLGGGSAQGFHPPRPAPGQANAGIIFHLRICGANKPQTLLKLLGSVCQQLAGHPRGASLRPQGRRILTALVPHREGPAPRLGWPDRLGAETADSEGQRGRLRPRARRRSQGVGARPGPKHGFRGPPGRARKPAPVPRPDGREDARRGSRGRPAACPGPGSLPVIRKAREALASRAFVPRLPSLSHPRPHFRARLHKAADPGLISSCLPSGSSAAGIRVTRCGSAGGRFLGGGGPPCAGLALPGM